MPIGIFNQNRSPIRGRTNPLLHRHTHLRCSLPVSKQFLLMRFPRHQSSRDLLEFNCRNADIPDVRSQCSTSGVGWRFSSNLLKLAPNPLPIARLSLVVPFVFALFGVPPLQVERCTIAWCKPARLHSHKDLSICSQFFCVSPTDTFLRFTLK